MKKAVLTILGLGAACSVCCLPLLAPLLAATGLSTMLTLAVGGASLNYLLCVLGPGIVIAGLLLAAALLLARRRASAVCDCAATCGSDQC